MTVENYAESVVTPGYLPDDFERHIAGAGDDPEDQATVVEGWVEVHGHSPEISCGEAECLLFEVAAGYWQGRAVRAETELAQAQQNAAVLVQRINEANERIGQLIADVARLRGES